MLFILHQLLIRIYDALGLFTKDVFTYEGVGRKRGGGEPPKFNTKRDKIL